MNYKKILNANKFKIVVKKKIEDEFYLPVNLFKKFELISIEKKKNYKSITVIRNLW